MIRLGVVKARFPNTGRNLEYFRFRFGPLVFVVHDWDAPPSWRTVNAIVFRWDHRRGWDGIALCWGKYGRKVAA